MKCISDKAFSKWSELRWSRFILWWIGVASSKALRGGLQKVCMCWQMSRHSLPRASHPSRDIKQWPVFKRPATECVYGWRRMTEQNRCRNTWLQNATLPSAELVHQAPARVVCLQCARWWSFFMMLFNPRWRWGGRRGALSSKAPDKLAPEAIYVGYRLL